MKTKTFLSLLVLILFCFSCKKEEPVEEVPRIKYGTGNVDFSDLRVGQKTTYERYIGVCEMVDIPGLPTATDTLHLEVVDMDYEVVTFSERFTEGSSLYQNGFDSPTLYKVTAKENYLLLPERDSSTLFYFYGNDTLNLQPPNPINLTQEFCVLLTPDSTFIGDDIGHIEEFQFFEEVLVDQYAVSCIPSIIAVEDGYLVYDKNGLNASFVSFERDFLSGIKPMEGWKKLK